MRPGGHEQDFSPDLLGPSATPDGFVMLFDGELRPITAANHYLFDQHYQPALGDRWQNTQHACADDLVAWWRYLASVGVAWDEIIDDDVRAYAARLKEQISTKTRAQLSAATLKRRIGTVVDFYFWAKHPHFIEGAPGKTGRQLAKSAGHFISVGSRPFVAGLKAREQAAGERIHPISIDDLERLRAALGPFTKSPEDTFECRDRLVLEVALHSGMRIEEVCSLTVYQIERAIQGLDRRDPHDFGKIKITKTKGAASRWVHLPRDILMALVDYIYVERAAVLEECRSKHGRYVGDPLGPAALFLNGKKSNSINIGNPLKKDSVSRRFYRIQINIGLTTTREIVVTTADGAIAGADGLTRINEVTIPLHTFHDLRHTFAVNYYMAALQAGVSEPWKKLQARLGHKSLKTTKDIYLDHLKFEEHKVSDIHINFLRNSRSRRA